MSIRFLVLERQRGTYVVLPRRRPQGLCPLALRPGELPVRAATRVCGQWGLSVPESAWTLVPAQTGSALGDLVLAADASRSSLLALPPDHPEFSVVRTELEICEAWVNPRKFAPDFITVLAAARRLLSGA